MPHPWPDEARELLHAVERDDVPLAVFADFLEEAGDALADGVRWLADHERRPRFIGRNYGYAWKGGFEPAAPGIPCRLPDDVVAVLVQRDVTTTATFEQEIRDAAELVTKSPANLRARIRPPSSDYD